MLLAFLVRFAPHGMNLSDIIGGWVEFASCSRCNAVSSSMERVRIPCPHDYMCYPCLSLENFPRYAMGIHEWNCVADAQKCKQRALAIQQAVSGSEGVIKSSPVAEGSSSRHSHFPTPTRTHPAGIVAR